MVVVEVLAEVQLKQWSWEVVNNSLGIFADVIVVM